MNQPDPPSLRKPSFQCEKVLLGLTLRIGDCSLRLSALRLSAPRRFVLYAQSLRVNIHRRVSGVSIELRTIPDATQRSSYFRGINFVRTLARLGIHLRVGNLSHTRPGILERRVDIVEDSVKISDQISGCVSSYLCLNLGGLAFKVLR